MNEPRGKNTVVLGICSSISLYKSCEIIRAFQQADHPVCVIMTQNAAKLISPQLFAALSGHDVLLDLFADTGQGRIPHIEMAREITLLLVAPATANMIGKLANGIADDFLSTFYLAVECPVAVAPAMNEKMYRHRQTQTNIRSLKASGVTFIEPEKGYLACGDEGWGRLAPPAEIVARSLELIRRSDSLAGATVLVTAGPTREFLDPVRFLTSPSSGKMGFEMAQEALRRGANVILISGPTALTPPPGVKFVSVETAQQMAAAVEAHADEAKIVVMTAAVADYMVAEPATEKIKKGTSLDIRFASTPDILEGLGRQKGGKILVGFAAETGDLEKNALDKLEKKNLDLIVANDISGAEIGFASDLNRVTIYHRSGKKRQTDRMSKAEISRIIWDEINDALERPPQKAS